MDRGLGEILSEFVRAGGLGQRLNRSRGLGCASDWFPCGWI